METATLLHRAAVESLASGLIAKFGDEVRGERTNQMIGHVVRQIMEAFLHNEFKRQLRLFGAPKKHRLRKAAAGY
jgi:hypothetical protein